MLNKLTLEQTIDYLQQVSVLLSDGYLLQDALQQVQPFQTKKTSRQTAAILAEIQKNISFSEALKYHSSLEPFLIQILKEAEIKKQLPDVLEKVVSYREQLFDEHNRIFRHSKRIFYYPFSLAVVALSIISILAIFVIPVFSDMFKSFGAELPFLTQYIVDLSSFYAENIFLILITFLLSTVVLREGVRSKSSWLYMLLNNMAIFGKLYQQSVAIYLLRTIHLMFSLNYPLERAFSAMEDLTDQYHTRKLKQLVDNLSNGEIPKDQILPLHILFLLRKCLKSKHIPTLFVSTAEKLSLDLKKRTDILKRFLDILSLIVIGILVGIVVVGMYLPIFKMGSVI
jgi:type IV pilus assembly protein PilC